MYRPFNLKNTFWQRLVMVLFVAAAAMVMIGPAQAAKVEYTISFTDTSTDATGSGTFLWDTETEIMTGLSWHFEVLDGTLVGSITDEGLAEEYHSWDSLANTYGELYYRLLTDPAGYMDTQHNPLSLTAGTFDATGDFDFVAFGAKRDADSSVYTTTYRFLDTEGDWVTEGYATAKAVPVPGSIGLLLTGVFCLGSYSRLYRKKA
jgi:hypothetical protein